MKTSDFSKADMDFKSTYDSEYADESSGAFDNTS
jgi:hypothetical protein